MLVVSNLSKRFRGADEPILSNISFTVNAGERIGLVGPNGSGKSTLIQIVMGLMEADGGSVTFSPPNLRVGYLAQQLEIDAAVTLRDVLFPQTQLLQQAEADVERLAARLAEGDDAVYTAYDEALTRLERHSRTVDPYEAESVLAGLDLGHLDLDSEAAALSGGQKTRLGLAALLLDDPQLLILDEPTNHLDVSGIEWLESWLDDFSGGALIVSHDRTFLDQMVTGIVALDEKTHTARVFAGHYSDYVATLRSEWDKQWSQWRLQQLEVTALQRDAQQTMAKAVRKENATRDSTQRRYAKKVAKRAQAKATRLRQYLADEDRVEKPERTWPLRLDNLQQVNALPAGREVITLDGVSVGYDAPLLEHLDLRLLAGERVVVIGPNGQGKSTLLKTLVGQIPPLAGKVQIAHSAKIGYLAQEQETLDPASTPLRTLMDAVDWHETEARTFLHFFLFAGDEVFTPVGLLSYGERACLMLAVLVAQGANLLVLDEPLNHLDVPARERFEQALEPFQGTVLAVVHDRYFVDKLATRIWHVGAGVLSEEIREVPVL